MTTSATAVTPTVFVIDGDDAVRASLERLILQAGWHPETFASARTFLAHPRAGGASCLILDVVLPDLDGLEVQQRAALERPEMPVVFVTRYGDISTTVQAMKAGAREFLPKPVDCEVLLRAIEQALEHSRRILEQVAKMEALRGSYESLTPRERQVMTLVVAGLLNKQVGGELGISEITVKAHRGRMMRKMRAASLPALVHMAGRLGLTPIPIG
jgi:FixJ family two-component response regulator